MPIPNYLKEISCDETKKGSLSIFTLKCPCGSTLFDVFESYLDQAEREACKPYCDALDRLYMSGHASTCTVDEDGTVHHWILLGEDLSGPKEEVFVPKPPVFSSIQVIKAKCSRCQKEQILFDSRYHGSERIDVASRSVPGRFSRNTEICVTRPLLRTPSEGE